MVAAVSTTINNSKTTSQNPSRPPLLPSDPENALANRRPKSREVTSRYLSSSSSSSSSSMSSTTSKRCPSPLISRAASSTVVMTPVPSTIKRSQSVERRRLVTPRPNGNNSSLDSRTGEMSAAQKMLFTSTRSLSVSFQGESFSLQVSKAKPAPSPSPISTVRKGTPERRKAITPARGGAAADHTENSKQERWPGRLRQPNSMSRSVDCTDERRKLGGGGSGGNVVRALQNSMVDNSSRALFETRLSTDSANAVLDKIQMQKKKDELVDGSDVRSDLVASDSESVSSGSNSEAHESNGFINQRGPRGIVVPARFWHETNNRLRRQTDPGSPVSKSNGLLKSASTPKLGVPKKFGVDSPVSSPKGVVNTRGHSSPIRGAVRPASPNKLLTSASSPVRGVSPSRVRNLAGFGVSNNLNSVSNTPSILSFAVDVRRGKICENRVVDAHLLKLIYNRLLQWRFVNARADAAMLAQRLNAERSLYNAWITTLKLRESVRNKRRELQLLRHNLKLNSILKGQMMYLEESAIMDREYSSSLLGAIEALRASTLRLPVVGGARADVQNVKDAISSAVDVMQAMASSIRLLLSKAGEVNSLVAELANVSTKEHALLGHCKELLSTISAMQVKECSMRTHIVQLERLHSSMTTKV